LRTKGKLAAVLLAHGSPRTGSAQKDYLWQYGLVYQIVKAKKLRSAYNELRIKKNYIMGPYAQTSMIEYFDPPSRSGVAMTRKRLKRVNTFQVIRNLKENI